VTEVAMSAASMVLATLQQNLSGIYVRAAVPNVAANALPPQRPRAGIRPALVG
jgi:hypothetical protein